MIYISNAFSLSMLDRDEQTAETLGRVTKKTRVPRPVEDPQAWLAARHLKTDIIVSAVGHADVAAIYSAALGIDIPVNRVSVKLEPRDELLVGQYVGPRLPEGATALPDGATIEWWRV